MGSLPVSGQGPMSVLAHPHNRHDRSSGLAPLCQATSAAHFPKLPFPGTRLPPRERCSCLLNSHILVGILSAKNARTCAQAPWRETKGMLTFGAMPQGKRMAIIEEGCSNGPLFCLPGDRNGEFLRRSMVCASWCSCQRNNLTLTRTSLCEVSMSVLLGVCAEGRIGWGRLSQGFYQRGSSRHIFGSLRAFFVPMISHPWGYECRRPPSTKSHLLSVFHRWSPLPGELVSDPGRVWWDVEGLGSMVGGVRGLVVQWTAGSTGKQVHGR